MAKKKATNPTNINIKDLESPAKVYKNQSQKREPYLVRAREAAAKTIVALFPKDGTSGSTTFDTPKQSFGARAVNFVASKIALAIMPPNTSMCRLVPTEEIMDEGADNDELAKSILKELTRTEQKLLRYINTYQVRVAVSEGAKQLVVAGNVLFYLPKDRPGARVFKLTDYIVQRDGMGTVLQLVTKEAIAYAALPTEMREALLKGGGKEDRKPDEQLELYTRVYMVEGAKGQPSHYVSYQEIEEIILEDTVNIHPADNLPWIATRLFKVDGEDYGRGFVEEYQGDLNSLEILSEALLDLAAIAASVRILVDPMGMTDVNKLAKAKNGAFVAGREQDVVAFQLNKLADLQVAKAQADAIEARLSYAFLLNSAVQRSGERVTAEEIRYVARELEDTMGGIYSILSQELQLPLIRVIMSQMDSRGELRGTDTVLENVDIKIITGMEALGRGQDLANIEKFVSILVQLAQAEGIERLKIDGIITQAASALSLDPSLFVKSEEELQAEQAAAQASAVDATAEQAAADSMGASLGNNLGAIM